MRALRRSTPLALRRLPGARALARAALAIATLAAGCGGDGDDRAPSLVDPTDSPSSPAPGEDGGAPLTGGGGDDAGGPGPSPIADPCASVPIACPALGASEGAGLTALDRCAFPMSTGPSFATHPPVVAALEGVATKSSLAAILADLNRDGVSVAAGAVPGTPSGVAQAFGWNAEDAASDTWIPQGISGSADASASGLVAGRRVVVVSWYHDTKGVRLSFVDVTSPQAPAYRHVLLVEPVGSAESPSFAPVLVHAGGLAWVGDLLYVVDTSRGLRVFDTRRVLQVATDVDSIGCAGGVCRGGLYKYVLPQLGAYAADRTCAPRFSFVSLDRSTTPPSLVTGEYCNDTTCSGPLAGRVFRWPLVDGKALAPGKSWPSEVFRMGQRQVQGGASRGGLFFFSSSAPAGGGGALYRVKGGKSATSSWIDSPEDLMVDEGASTLWSLSEAPSARAVMAVRLTSYPAP